MEWNEWNVYAKQGVINAPLHSCQFLQIRKLGTKLFENKSNSGRYLLILVKFKGHDSSVQNTPKKAKKQKDKRDYSNWWVQVEACTN